VSQAAYRHMRGSRAGRCALFLLVALLGLPGCRKLKDQGFVLVLDDAYHASIVATSKVGFGAPDGILWRAGRFYFADEGGEAVRVWDGATTMRTFGDSTVGFSSPEDLVMDADSNIFVTDDNTGDVWKVDSAGAPHLLAGKAQGLVSTEGIALAPDGTLLVGDGEKHTVFRVTKAGAVSVFLGPEYGITKPESMVFDSAGNLYIADNEDNILYLLDPQHHLHRLIDKRAEFSPETIVASGDTIYITDSKAWRVYRLPPRGPLQTIATFGGNLRNVQGITHDDRGNLFITIQSDLKRRVGYVVRLGRAG
jgi:sugar lactone lactonase YvrE